MALPSRRLMIIVLAGLAVVGVVTFVLLGSRSGPPVQRETLPGTAGEFAFHATGELAEPCTETCQSTLLNDGRVLIINGGEEYGMNAHIEVFDPANWTFTSLGTVDFPCCQHVVVLDNGEVLLMTPHLVLVQSPWEPTETYYEPIGLRVFLLDPSTGRAKAVGSTLDDWESINDSVLLPDGRVLLAGRYRTQAQFRGLALFDPEAETLTRVTLVDQLETAVLTLLPMPDGRVLALSQAQGGVVFDPTDDSVTKPAIGVPLNMVHAQLGDGRHLVMSTSGRRASIFDPVTVTFESIGEAPGQVDNLYPLDDGRVLGAPGQDNPWFVFDPTTMSFTVLEDGPGTPMTMSSGVASLGDGRLLFTSGPGETVVFDPTTTRFVEGPRLSSSRSPAIVASLGDGRILMAGTSSGHMWVAYGIEALQDLLDGLSRTGEMLVEGGTTRPSGCCASDSTQFVMETLENPLAMIEARRFIEGDLSFMMTASEGAFEGATKAGYFAEVYFEDITGQWMFGGRTVSEDFDPLPTDCTQGCRFVIQGEVDFDFGSGPDSPTLDDLLVWMQVGVYVIYDGPSPAAAEELTVTVED